MDIKSQIGTELTEEYLKSLPEWVQNVLLVSIKPEPKFIYDSNVDYTIPLDIMPKVRLVRDGNSGVSHIVRERGYGKLDVFVLENGVITEYSDCTIATINYTNNK